MSHAIAPNADQRTTDTRQRILDVAQDLVQRLGPNGMSYQDISAAVGIRKASIHYHFPAKEDLLVALVEQFGRNALAAVDGVIADGGSASAQMKRVIGLEEGQVRDGRKACLFAMVTAESEKPHSRPMDEVRRYVDQFVDRLAKILEAGRGDGSFDFAGDPRRTAAAVFSLMQGAMFNARLHGDEKWFAQTCRQMLKLLGAKG